MNIEKVNNLKDIKFKSIKSPKTFTNYTKERRWQMSITD